MIVPPRAPLIVGGAQNELTDLKKCAIDGMLVLLRKGCVWARGGCVWAHARTCTMLLRVCRLAMEVLEAVNGTELDMSLVRYFVSGVLDLTVRGGSRARRRGPLSAACVAGAGRDGQ